ncbi:MAG: type II secretion system protein M [Deltaproteobacteria bacterium]|nr:type II secretion system protein M [Deltaproteobacteria bacterium]
MASFSLSSLRSRLEPVQAAFGRLTQQEQLMVIAAASGVVIIILVGLSLGVSSAIDRAEHRVTVKTDQLTQVLQLQGEYKTRTTEREARLKELGRSNVRLVSLVEDVARQAGVEIGQLKPEDGEPSPDGIIESRVDLKASNLSADRLQDFLSRIEKGPGVVVVRRLKLSKPYKKDTVDVEMTVTTFKLKAS